jgi:hypothetical protein
MGSVLAQILHRLYEVRTEKESAHSGVAPVEFKKQQIDSRLCVARFLTHVHLHLVPVVRCSFELPGTQHKRLHSPQVCQHQLCLSQ